MTEPTITLEAYLCSTCGATVQRVAGKFAITRPEKVICHRCQSPAKIRSTNPNGFNTLPPSPTPSKQTNT